MKTVTDRQKIVDYILNGEQPSRAHIDRLGAYKPEVLVAEMKAAGVHLVTTHFVLLVGEIRCAQMQILELVMPRAGLFGPLTSR